MKRSEELCGPGSGGILDSYATAIVANSASISELSGYLCTAMFSSFWWFMIFMPAQFPGLERSTGAVNPRSVNSLFTALAYPAKVAAQSPSLFV